ncbi:hypothetical protein AB0M87_03540 [Streptomyces sp. NPDC051320]|uniref:hypothetical protein n=1 Tax=Streptomyces sp. NPDC051320 TaxID=3154644 RepID=UPI003421C33E
MILTRGARTTGAVVCALLALTVLCWVVRDLSTADGPVQLWRFWEAGPSGMAQASLTTTLYDLMLVVVYAVVAVAALRSPVAGSALVAAAVVTLVLRVPGLWVQNADWMGHWSSDELRFRALVSTLIALAGAFALIITVAAGRRPADGAQRALPTPPGRGPAVTAGLLLLLAALVGAGWEIYWIRTLLLGVDPKVYSYRFTGQEGIFMPLLGVPAGWLAVLMTLLRVVAAIGAFARAPFARPLGMVAAAGLTASGALSSSLALRLHLFSHFADRGLRDQLSLLTGVFALVAGVVVLVLLAMKGESVTARRPQPLWQQPAGQGGGFGPPLSPPPPSSPPPGW